MARKHFGWHQSACTDGMNVRRQLLHFTHQPFERSRRRRAEHLDEVARNARCTSRQHGETRANESETGEQLA